MNAASTEAYSRRSSLIRHALAVGNIDQVERSGRHKVLITSLPADVVREMKQQGVRRLLVNLDPVG